VTFSEPRFCRTCRWFGDSSELIVNEESECSEFFGMSEAHSTYLDTCPDCGSEDIDDCEQCDHCLQPLEYCKCIENALNKSARQFLEDLANEPDGKVLAMVEKALNEAKARLAGVPEECASHQPPALVHGH
jgi:hypothetical protein